MAKNPHKSLELDESANSGDYQRGNNHLLLIGIDAYVHHNRLNNARRDAETMRDLLIRHYEFVPERITELYDEDATLRGIIESLEGLERRLTPADNLLIYFSGHGAMNRKKSQGFWVPVDAEKTTAHYLPNDRVRAIIGDMEAHHIYLIVDACFAGSTILRSETAVYELMEANPSRRALTSGRKEVVSDGKPGGHSPFFDCIRHQLGKGELLSAVELENYVIHNTPRTAHQLPEAAFIFGLGDKSGKFVFHPKRDQLADYQAVMETNTAQAWTAFLAAYPDFAKKAEIETHIAQLQAQEAWAEATSRNTIAAYRSYRQRFPQGAHRSEALDRIEQLEAARDWKRVQRQHTISGYERFLDRYPRSSQRPEAEAAIEQLLKQEQEAERTREAEATRRAEAERRRAAEAQTRLAEAAQRKEAERLAAERAERERQEEEAEQKRKEAEAAQARLTKARKQKEAEVTPDSGLIPLPNMIHISGGTFQMGSNENDYEKPIHTVTVSSFYLAETTVTFAQYDYFCEQTGRSKPNDYGWGRGNRPAIWVSWDDAQTYIQWLNRQPRQSGWRLPTEAEWEYAAGGGASDRTKYAGTSNEGSLGSYAVYGGKETSPVKSKEDNGLGLYDMSGNVWEWCEDKWHSNYQGAPTDGSAWTSGSSSSRVIRGGSWNFNAGYCRVAIRNGKSSRGSNLILGFRLARS